MLIGVISDTHIPERAKTIPDKVFELFEDVDLILHAGDLVSFDVSKQLEEIAPTRCVQGNMDYYFGLNLPKNDIIDVEGIKIGLNHGEVYPRGDTQQLKYIAQELGVDVLISGHTHWAFMKKLNDIILLNPGSPTAPRMSDPSVMILDINDNTLESRIIKIGDPVCKILKFKGPDSDE
jgi:putative phosphoesterase